MQQTENPVAPFVAFSAPDSVGIVALDDQILGQVVGGAAAAIGPGTGWLVSPSGPGTGW